MGSEILNNRNSLSMPSSHSCRACPILFRLICGNYDQLPTEVSGLCNDSNSPSRRLCYLCCHLRTLCALVAKAARMLHRVVFGTNNSQPHNLRAHDTSNVPYIWVVPTSYMSKLYTNIVFYIVKSCWRPFT